ncbi:methionine/alanine import family NSS transporter small subunit [Demequina sp. B12]|uniref:methionine/alanine import family NSS transporter small subunit n=1 Tax=Demequina sp. B12 TaxID=2992757 RepID=UPI00237BFC9B|nr:methionine/alanine import family NSS transporter small subunit [Demequina sp. B12]MDE0573283.1 methionine/alanine import family NSS transporter small subunit [Demequina sp. B12]
MSAQAVILMIVSMVVIWGGLAASIVFLARMPEREDLPDGGHDDLGSPPVSDT